MKPEMHQLIVDIKEQTIFFAREIKAGRMSVNDVRIKVGLNPIENLAYDKKETHKS